MEAPTDNNCPIQNGPIGVVASQNLGGIGQEALWWGRLVLRSSLNEDLWFQSGSSQDSSAVSPGPPRRRHCLRSRSISFLLSLKSASSSLFLKRMPSVTSNFGQLKIIKKHSDGISKLFGYARISTAESSAIQPPGRG